jgi:hypothetical protein
MPTIATADGRTTLHADYHPALPDRAKAIGGRWNATQKAWVFDARDEDRVRALARLIYGTDGSEPAATVTVRLHLDRKFGASGCEFWYAGRQILRRSGRDKPVRLGYGVILIKGGFPASGGSWRYPDIDPCAGTVLEVRDLPATKVDPSEPGVEIVTAEAIHRSALEVEADELRARLARIESELARSQKEEHHV